MELMRVKEVAERLKCGVSHVYAVIDAGELSCYKIGLGKQGGIRVSEEHLTAYLKNRENKNVLEGHPLKHLLLD
jgi:excisionase family DNA binding protein